jgi:Protein of unknown function (DUF4031)
MPVYVDDWFQRAVVGSIRGTWSHMVAGPGTPVEELHRIAAAIGLRRDWFQDESHGGEHYDVTKTKRAQAIAAGAIPISWRDMGKMHDAMLTGQPWEPPAAGPVQLTFGAGEERQ